MKKYFDCDEKIFIIVFTSFFILAAFSIVQIGPITWFDSGKYVLTAEEISRGTPFNNAPPLEVKPGYPLLIKLLNFDFYKIIYIQLAIVFLGLISLYLISKELLDKNISRLVVILGLLFSGLINQAGAIMTEAVNCSIIIISFYFYTLSQKRENNIYILVSVMLIGLSGWFRNLGTILWVIPVTFWFVSGYSNALSNQNIKRQFFIKTLVVLTIVPIIYAMTAPTKRDDISFSHSLSVLWLRAIQFQYAQPIEKRPSLEQTAPNWLKDYNDWVRKKMMPSQFVRVDPFWAKNENDVIWERLSEPKRAYWWKSPLYMRTAYYGESVEQALYWQKQVAFNEIKLNWDTILKTSIPKDFNKTLGKPLRIYKRNLTILHDSNQKDKFFKRLMSKIISLPAQIHLMLFKASIYIFLPILSLISCLIFLIRRPSNTLAMIASYICIEMLISIIVAGGLPRYALLLHVFSPLFIVGAFSMKWFKKVEISD